MYKPDTWHQRCGKLPDYLDERMAASKIKRSKVDQTQELYVIPRTWPIEKHVSDEQKLSTWPRYEHGEFGDAVGGKQRHGESMLELSQEEWQALQIVVLRTEVRKEHYGATRKFNLKKDWLEQSALQERACMRRAPADGQRKSCVQVSHEAISDLQ